MTYSFPHTLVAGTPENVTDVQENFTGLATDTEYAYSTYKTIIPWLGGQAADIGSTGMAFAPTSVSAAVNSAYIFYVDPADHTANTRTTKYRVRVLIATNQVAPAITITFGLYPVTLSAGAAGSANTWTRGPVTSGSTVAYASPSASTTQQGNSGDFTAPVAGYYSLGMTASGTGAANSRTDLMACLQVRQV